MKFIMGFITLLSVALPQICHASSEYEQSCKDADSAFQKKNYGYAAGHYTYCLRDQSLSKKTLSHASKQLAHANFYLYLQVSNFTKSSNTGKSLSRQKMDLEGYFLSLANMYVHDAVDYDPSNGPAYCLMAHVKEHLSWGAYDVLDLFQKGQALGAPKSECHYDTYSN